MGGPGFKEILGLLMDQKKCLEPLSKCRVARASKVQVSGALLKGQFVRRVQNGHFTIERVHEKLFISYHAMRRIETKRTIVPKEFRRTRNRSCPERSDLPSQEYLRGFDSFRADRRICSLGLSAKTSVKVSGKCWCG